MGRINSSLDFVRIQETLISVLDTITPTCGKFDYCLVGTGAALLQGVELPAADIDILVKERKDIDMISKALSSFKCLTPPKWLPESFQYYASYEVNGIEVEFSTVEVESSADTIETFGRGPWEHYNSITCGTYTIPAVVLELRLLTELYRDRPDRYEPLLRFMQEKGCDMELIYRGFEVARLSPAIRDKVINRLHGK